MSLPDNINPVYKELLERSGILLNGKSERPKEESEERRRIPLMEQIDLAAIFDGNGEPEIFLTKPFVRVARMIVLHTWDGTTLNYNQFGDGGGGAVNLDSPLDISYGLKGRESKIVPGGIDATKDYMRIAFDTDVVIDTLGVSKQVYFTARLSFLKLMGNLEGLNMIGRSVKIDGPVDGETPVADFGNDFIWTFEGWGWDI